MKTLRAIGFFCLLAASPVVLSQGDLIEFPNGQVYSGETLDGQPSGRGRMFYPFGAIYEGGWKEGKKNGEGKQAHSDGRVLVGEWENGFYKGNQRSKDLSDSLVLESKRWGNDIAVREETKVKNGDFSDVESCRNFTQKDYITYLTDTKIRPTGGMHWLKGRLEDFSESQLVMRDDIFGLVIIDITDSPKWLRESSIGIGSDLIVIGFYDNNVDTLLTSGASIKLQKWRAKCIEPSWNFE